MTSAVSPPRLPGLIGELPAWMERSACSTADPDMFFGRDPGFGYRTEPAADKHERERAAKALCARCPVRELCLTYAMTTPEHDGVWGGKTANERRAIRRKALAAARRNSAKTS